jgi:hypothetical protein
LGPRYAYGGGIALPADLRAFLYSCIHTVDEIEVLLRLRATVQPTTVRELAADIRLAPFALRQVLETLTARGLLRADAGAEVRYRYSPDSPEFRRYADLLAEYYGSQRDLVVRALSARAARTFADAFKLRDEERGGES